MKFDFWIKRQGTSYDAIIKNNNLLSYLDLVEYAKTLGLSPPDKCDVEKYFQKEKRSPKRRSSSSVRSSVRGSKANSNRSNSKSKSVKQKSNNSLRRGSKKSKENKSLDNKKNRDSGNNSSAE